MVTGERFGAEKDIVIMIDNVKINGSYAETNMKAEKAGVKLQ